MSSRLTQAVLLDLAIERVARHLERPRGRHEVAAVRAQAFLDQPALGLLDRRPRRRAPRPHSQQGRIDHRTLDEHQRALELVAELAHVPGPVVTAQRIARVVGERRRGPAGSARELLEDVGRQHEHVVTARAQRWHQDLEHVEPVEQILAKPLRGNLVGEALVTRGDDPDVDAHGLLRADRLDLAGFDRAQHLRLRRRG